MHGPEHHHAPTQLRLIAVFSALLVLLLGLLAVSKLFDRTSGAREQTAKRSFRPKRNPWNDGNINQVTAIETTKPRSAPESTQAPPDVSPTNATVAAAEPAPAAVPRPRSFAERNRSDLTGAPAEAVRRFKGAVLTGKATLRGKPPANPVVDLRNDANCGKSRTNILYAPLYVVGTNGGLADVVVYLKGFQKPFSPPPRDPVILDQVGCRYSPYVFALRANQPLFVKNSDPFLHNVHTTPNVPGNKESNKAQLPNTTIELRFDQPEMFLRIKCDVHPWMFSYACVFTHPFFAVTGPDGQFVIEDVPIGHYFIEARHRKLGVFSQELEVKNRKEVIGIDFQFEQK